MLKHTLPYSTLLYAITVTDHTCNTAHVHIILYYTIRYMHTVGAPRQRPAFACSYVVGASLAHGRGATPLSTAAVDDEQLRIALAAAAAEQAKQDALETHRAAHALRDFRTGKLQLLVTTDACSEVSHVYDASLYIYASHSAQLICT
jgi:hypothetical protein